MEYGKIIAVTGLPGLFELLNSKNDGAIVRSLDDKTTKFVSSRVHNFSHLESIEVFTIRDNVNLIEIFNAMGKDGGKVPDGKDGAALKKYFEKVYGDLDFERVYSSDLKKMAKWYEILNTHKIEIKLTEHPVEEEEVEEPVAEEMPAPKKAGLKAPASEAKTSVAEKKSAAKEIAEEAKPASGDTAADKPVAKKKAEPKEDEENAPAKKAAAKKAAPKKKA